MPELARHYATGKRKNATAKVWLTPGTGEITVNGRPLDEYVCRPTLSILVRRPMEITESMANFNVTAQALGGGIAGQAGALRHGIARARGP